MKRALIGILLSSFILFGCAQTDAHEVEVEGDVKIETQEELIEEEDPYVHVPIIGKKIPQFDNLEGSDGNFYNLSDFEGKPMLLMFETVECHFCEKERPSIIKLEEKYGVGTEDSELHIVTISVSETMEEIMPHVIRHNINHVWLSEGEQFVSITYLAYGTPDHFFVDQDGVLRAHRKGYLTYEQLETHIQNLFRYNTHN